MQTSHATRLAPIDTVRAASRQMWLAGLGAVVVTRDWAGKEAGQMFRSLVREGTVVESQAMRYVGSRLDTSVTRANALLREVRGTLEQVIRGYAGSAVTLVRQTLPRALPAIALPAQRAAAAEPAPKRRKAATRSTRGVSAKVKPSGKRGVKRASKR